MYDILTDKNNIIIASFPGEFDKNVYSQRRTQRKLTFFLPDKISFDTSNQPLIQEILPSIT